MELVRANQLPRSKQSRPIKLYQDIYQSLSIYLLEWLLLKHLHIMTPLQSRHPIHNPSIPDQVKVTS